MSYLPKVVMKMRVGGASNRSLKNIIHKTKEDVKALEKQLGFLASCFAIQKPF